MNARKNNRRRDGLALAALSAVQNERPQDIRLAIRSKKRGRDSPLGRRGPSTLDQLREVLVLEAEALLADRRPGEDSARRRERTLTPGWTNAKAGRDRPARIKSRTIGIAPTVLENSREGKSSLEETMLELYHAEISVRAVDGITSALWGDPLGSDAIGELSGQVTTTVANWLNRPLARRYASVFAEGTELRWRASEGERIVPILAAMGVGLDGYREIIAVMAGSKGESANFAALFRSLRERGIEGAEVFVGDHLSGFEAGLQEVFPFAAVQGCITRFRERAVAVATSGGRPFVDELMETIYECADASSARAKIQGGVLALEQMGEDAAAALLREKSEPTLTRFAYPESAWPFMAGNATLIKNLREIRERARAIGAFSDESTAVTLAAARLRHRMRVTWGRFRYGRSGFQKQHALALVA